MTAEEVRASRELDALIHRQVFGVEFVTASDGWFWTPDGSDLVQVPEYSTNIVDAWKVVERMAELGYHLSLFEDTEEGWTARFHIFDHRCKGYGEGDTAAEAICRAAYEAEGYRVSSTGTHPTG